MIFLLQDNAVSEIRAENSEKMERESSLPPQRSVGDLRGRAGGEREAGKGQTASHLP